MSIHLVNTAEQAREPHDAALAQHVVKGLSAPQKSLSSAWFYDDEGTRLFQRIMDLPEYYLTRAEHEIFQRSGSALARTLPDGSRGLDLIELGAGDGSKTLTLLQQLLLVQPDFVYHPVDISSLALEALAQRFARALPQARVQPFVGDYAQHWPAVDPRRRQIVMFLGSSLGNFSNSEAQALLRRVHMRLRPGDALMLGLDLVKDPHQVLAAYNDSEGVTAQFNLNLLRRLNRELGMNFDLRQFTHYASYNPLDAAARSFLVSQRRQTVHSQVLGLDFAFQRGETIYTEQSQKYSAAVLEELAAATGFTPQARFVDASEGFCVLVWGV